MYSVECRNVHFTYSAHDKALLSNIDLAIEPGEIVGLSGKSGSGKSTLADILLNILPPDHGQVLWNARDCSALGRRDRGRERSFYQKIFQDPAASFPPNQTVGRAISDLAKHCGYVCQQRKYITGLIYHMGLEPAVLDRYPDQLSGGEMQRLALARVMMLRPRFVVADEPTSRLDPSVQAEVVRLIEHLVAQRRWSMLFISHDEDLLSTVCDRGMRLEGGRAAGASLVPLFQRTCQERKRDVDPDLLVSLNL